MTRERTSFLIIGVFAGIIVMQWAMPDAQSAPAQIDLIGESLTIVDKEGKTTGLLFNGENGPLFAIGPDLTSGESRILLGFSPQGPKIIADGEKIEMLYLNTDDRGVKVEVGDWGGSIVATGRTPSFSVENPEGDMAYMSLSEDMGGVVGTFNDGTVTGRLPLDVKSKTATAAKIVSWGDIKAEVVERARAVSMR